MRKFSWIVAAVAFALGLIGGWYLQKLNLVDACMDAGGQWEHAGSYCRGV
jgi:hypothetical protein